MAKLELSETAVEDLARLVGSHSLPAGTTERVKRSLAPLEQFPRMGAELEGRWAGFRFLLGPWRWLIIVHAYLDHEERVVVVTIRDGRSSQAATHERA